MTGVLEKYGWPGGYPVAHLVGTGVACTPCAQEALDDSNDGEGGNVSRGDIVSFVIEDTSEPVVCDFAWKCDHIDIATI
jgi:hypothetical protein